MRAFRLSPKTLALAGLCAAFVLSLVMLALKPIPGAMHYEYGVLLAGALVAIVALYRIRPRTFFGPKALLFVLVCGLALGAVNVAVLNPEAEIVKVYRTVFEAMESGQNPYTSGTIFHEIEKVGPVYGNFNYPPLEIYPYYLAYKIAGTWNLTVLVITMLVIQGLCGLILFRMFPGLGAARLLPFLPMILLGEIKTTAGMTLLVTALILWLIKMEREEPRPVHGLAIAVLFGLGLMAKFLILPLMAAYYAHQLKARDATARLVLAVDASISAATAILMMAPFGVANVLRSTLFFNVVLEDRAVFTTFYPNILSGPLAWAGLGALYPFAAGALMLLAFWAAPKLELLPALVTAAVVFMIVAPTPEPQFIPALLLIVVVAQGLAFEDEAAARARKNGRGSIRVKAPCPD
jgi:hypothetical protein